jgi:hypothetical protein
MLTGVGPGLCRTSENSVKRRVDFAEFTFPDVG